VGDSFADLAIRQNAFQVAKVLMNAGIDPLMENSEGRDMFGTMKEQYHQIGLQLREVQELKTQASQKVMVPSAVEHILSEECRLLDSFHYLSEFGEDLKVNLEKRVKEIEVDKILQRRAHLRNEVCCPSVYFSVS
jgi:type II secretory pathway component PulM